MKETQKSKYSKLARFFIDVDKFNHPEQQSKVKVSVAERVNYAAKVFFFMALLIFLVPIVLVLFGVGGSEFRQVGWMIPMVLLPFILIAGIAWSFSNTYKKNNIVASKDSNYKNTVNL